MFLGGEDAQSGTGGIDGDTANLGSIINVQNTDDATKATYYTPRLAGFQLGASYVPDTGDDGGRDGAGFDEAFKNVVGVGVNWVGEFGGVEPHAQRGRRLRRVGGPTADRRRRRQGLHGRRPGRGGRAVVRRHLGPADRLQRGQLGILGLKYAFGEASASVGYSWVDDDALDDKQNVFVVSGDVGLAPGLDAQGRTSPTTARIPAHDDSAGDQDDTLSGVISIQVDY